MLSPRCQAHHQHRISSKSISQLEWCYRTNLTQLHDYDAKYKNDCKSFVTSWLQLQTTLRSTNTWVKTLCCFVLKKYPFRDAPVRASDVVLTEAYSETLLRIMHLKLKFCFWALRQNWTLSPGNWNSHISTFTTAVWETFWPKCLCSYSLSINLCCPQ